MGSRPCEHAPRDPRSDPRCGKVTRAPLFRTAARARSRGYDVAVWDSQIQPALADLQQALHTVQGAAPARERTLEIHGAAHLSAALALGYHFREPTRWRLRLHHFDRFGRQTRAPDLTAGKRRSHGRARTLRATWS